MRIKIGSIEIEGFAALAPMAGVADRAMRELCRSYGAAYTVSELISAKGVSMGDRKSDKLLALTEGERPAGVQLFGSDPATVAAAAVHAMKYSPDFIDINMGCPAPKVVTGGGGSALHKNPTLAGRIVKAVAESVSVPVTVKIRAGWDENSINAVEMAKICEASGACAVTVHGRTRSQMYTSTVNLDIIRDVKRGIDIPVIGNGDICSPTDAARMLEYTGCDFLMVGRAAMGAPWIFPQITAFLSEGVILPDPPLAEKLRILLNQVSAMIEYRGEYTAMREARKHSGWYVKGLHGAAELRRECGGLKKYDDLKALIDHILKKNKNREN